MNSRFWYRLLESCARVTGPWLLTAFARLVAVGYFFFSPRKEAGLRFYGRLFPERSAAGRQLAVFLQYQRFTTIHSDRFRARCHSIDFTTEGLEQLKDCLQARGAVLLMSHLGNWEMAARLLPQALPELKLLLFMGEKQREGVEAAQKAALRADGVRVLAAAAADNNPALAVEGIRFLESGGVVSMPGDVLLKPEQRHFTVRFLDGRARIPAAPFVMAWLAGAPVFAFFAFRTGRGSYHFTLSAPLLAPAGPQGKRQNRALALQEAAEHYAALLEQALRSHPADWFHFDHFVADDGEKLSDHETQEQHEK